MISAERRAEIREGALSRVGPRFSLEPRPGGPVPLPVDDMVNSRSTFTVAARRLRSNGGGAVWPLALALEGQDR